MRVQEPIPTVRDDASGELLATYIWSKLLLKLRHSSREDIAHSLHRDPILLYELLEFIFRDAEFLRPIMKYGSLTLIRRPILRATVLKIVRDGFVPPKKSDGAPAWKSCQFSRWAARAGCTGQSASPAIPNDALGPHTRPVLPPFPQWTHCFPADSQP
jgi:hypothetical protein